MTCHHQAKKIGTNEFAAIKVIKLEPGDDIQIIQQEIIMMRDCRHPNIISYFGSYLRRDKLWICMEYCGGGSLQDIYQSEYDNDNDAAIQVTRSRSCQLLFSYSSSHWTTDRAADSVHVS